METFMNNVLSRPGYSQKKPDVFLGSDNVKPLEGASFINFGKF
jgi:hypothetical protein